MHKLSAKDLLTRAVKQPYRELVKQASRFTFGERTAAVLTNKVLNTRRFRSRSDSCCKSEPHPADKRSKGSSLAIQNQQVILVTIKDSESSTNASVLARRSCRDVRQDQIRWSNLIHCLASSQIICELRTLLIVVSSNCLISRFASCVFLATLQLQTDTMSCTLAVAAKHLKTGSACVHVCTGC